jgi:hypothetical protein
MRGVPRVTYELDPGGKRVLLPSSGPHVLTSHTTNYRCKARFAIHESYFPFHKMAGNRPIHRIFESVSITEQSGHKIIVGIDYGTTFSGTVS